MARGTTSDTGQPVAAKKNRLKLIMVVAVALLVSVGLSAAGTWFFLSKDRPQQEEGTIQPIIAQAKQQALYESLEPAFVVNFQTEGRTRYMQVSLALMARDEQQLAMLRSHMPALRNQLVMLFSSQDFAQLNTPLGLDMLKQKVTATVQELAVREVGVPVVEQVLFTNFVMQ
ncbi:MAG: flagellar basal body-associated FliL family protein [Thiopseudomonas sp.]